MNSIREIRRKIKSIKSTQQITQAMKMVATARLHRAQSSILNSRPFAMKLNELISDILDKLDIVPENIMKFIVPETDRKSKQSAVIFLVTADRGLCGSFNNTLIRKTIETIREYKEYNIKLITVGKKGRDYFIRTSQEIYREYSNIFNNLGYVHAEIIGNDIIGLYLSQKISKIIVIYQQFKSVLHQELTVTQLLPLNRAVFNCPEKTAVTGLCNKTDFLYEPEKEKLLEILFPRYIKSQIYRILLESRAAEFASRMVAMDQATNNAAELLDSLTMELNKIRQTGITTEISDIVGASEAIR